MKKVISLLFAVVISVMCLSVSAFANTSIIDDQANLYTDEQLAELEARQQEVSDYTGWNIVVVTTNVGFGEDGYNAIEYAESYYKNLFGSYSADGILYLVDIDYRHFAIGGEPDTQYFNDARVQAMFKKCNERYMDYDDVGNLNTFYDMVIANYDAGPFTESSAVPGKSVFDFDIAILMGIIAAIIGVLIVIARYKFKYTPTANNYLDQNRINFYRRTDRFVREFTTRIKNDSDSGGGHGSSGGHSMGGGGGGGRR